MVTINNDLQYVRLGLAENVLRKVISNSNYV